MPAHTTKKSAREREIFLQALDLPTPQARSAFAKEACGNDGALLAAVVSLLDSDLSDDFLEVSAVDRSVPGPASLASAVQAEKPGSRVGHYQLLERIGEGGCGVVFLAEQFEPIHRRVALKVIKLGMDTTTVIARFQAERHTLALMDHPNIAHVLDAGATDAGRPFFIMELVEGVKITEFCNQQKLSVRERAALFIQVCKAIEHAHQKGIIHRDIKPSNILVTLQDGVPVPKVIDFGIAKATDHRLSNKPSFTAVQTFIGTPAYTSPEQAEMSGLDVDTRTDIYSLGVLLYELLTGQTPFDPDQLQRCGLDEMRRVIREDEPDRPSTRVTKTSSVKLAERRHVNSKIIVPQVVIDSDLDWIVMKCLEKDRSRRYETASALAADIQRFLESEPVLARPPSNLYRFEKLLRRHRLGVAAAAAVAFALITGASLSIWQAVRATRAEQISESARQQEAELRVQAVHEKRQAQLNEYVADMNVAQQSLAAGNLGRAVQLLGKHSPKAGEQDLRGFEWRYLWKLSQGSDHVALPPQEGTVNAMAYSPAGDLLAAGTRDYINFLKVGTRESLFIFQKGADSILFSPDGSRCFIANSTGLSVLRTKDWSEEIVPGRFTSPAALSADGLRLAVLSREGVRILNTADWTELALISGASAPLAISRDGLRIAAMSRAGLQVHSLPTGGKVAASAPVLLEDSLALSGFGSGPNRRLVTFSPDGSSVVAARNTSSKRGAFVLSVWDSATGKETATMPRDPEHVEHVGAITWLDFSHDGNILATGSYDHSARLWDLASGRCVMTLQGHLNEVWSLAFSPDGKNIVTGSKDGSLNIWPAQPKAAQGVISGDWLPVGFSSDGRKLAAFSSQQVSLAFFDLETQRPLQELPLIQSRFRSGPVMALSADLNRVVQGRNDGQIELWDSTSPEKTSLKLQDTGINTIATSPDGRSVIAGGRNTPLQWWNLQQPFKPIATLDAQNPVFSPDGRTMVAFTRGLAEVQVWDATSAKFKNKFLVPGPARGMVAVSSDGRILAIASGITETENYVQLWDLHSGTLLGICSGHKQPVSWISFAPDNLTLATCCGDGTLKLWNISTRQELLSIRTVGGRFSRVAFSPDGSLLAGSYIAEGTTELRFFRAPLLIRNEATSGKDKN